MPDWLILACFIRDSYTADATFTPLENRVWLANERGNYWILYHNTNKEASTCAVFCWKALRKRWSTEEVGKNTRLRFVFSPTLLSCSSASCVLYNRTQHSRGFFICLLKFVGRIDRADRIVCDFNTAFKDGSNVRKPGICFLQYLCEALCSFPSLIDAYHLSLICMCFFFIYEMTFKDFFDSLSQNCLH